MYRDNNESSVRRHGKLEYFRLGSENIAEDAIGKRIEELTSS
jgi:hypothetical protein